MIGRLVVRPGAAARGTIMHLALRLVDYARSRGLALVRLRRTLTRDSQSAYLIMLDAQGRRWIIRVSDHYRPNDAAHCWPHFDFVTRDVDAGFASACGTIDLIASGAFPWHDPDDEADAVADRMARCTA